MLAACIATACRSGRHAEDTLENNDRAPHPAQTRVGRRIEIIDNGPGRAYGATLPTGLELDDIAEFSSGISLFGAYPRGDRATYVLLLAKDLVVVDEITLNERVQMHATCSGPDGHGVAAVVAQGCMAGTRVPATHAWNVRNGRLEPVVTKSLCDCHKRN
jgi:hypothetical protein